MLGFVLASLFVVLLAAVKAVSGPLPADVGLELGIQHWLVGWGVPDQLADAGFGVLSLAPVAVALLVTIASRRFRSALIIVASVLSAWIVGGALQIIVGRPRPSTTTVHVYAIDRSPGFPSISVSGEVVLVCVVLLLILRGDRVSRRRALKIGAIAAGVCLILVGSLAEIDIGRHWPSDVLGGWLFGGAWFGLLLAADGRLRLSAYRSHHQN